MGEEALFYPKQMNTTEMKKQGRPTMGSEAVVQRLSLNLFASDSESAPLQAPSQKDHNKSGFR